MPHVEDVSRVLSETNIQAGGLMGTLVESQYDIEALANMLATVTQGSENELVQQALANFALAKTQLSEIVGVLHDATDKVSEYQQAL
ncbi:hypothetical protein A8924_1532 [Saccharopolyspora erythraea NRRL 2338]|uniref:Uncharacterized protein n=2 Tax=Saccharopolyspora erythraea TaxID=1836 RepID=A4F8U1_SACEN|nr:hypothetical protein [Saccharopolyspora erythraea]EQD86780.1 hypothetical protein N599_07950 [Saccharopolyspora erythraea D]PFG94261.1 hypothetical protein A8924_1532 [Saccharopolyspora erythraea NRRL 2338]QRK91033.1 hypothetical protein JQX30_06205 [Saccharopolyspora erythraea]CAM00466.1 hypothetical protein SACE_1135 [Saccharopolyspora erythraea NRRL 2338]